MVGQEARRLRAEMATLQTEVDALRTAAASSKIEIQGLQQQVEKSKQVATECSDLRSRLLTSNSDLLITRQELRAALSLLDQHENPQPAEPSPRVKRGSVKSAPSTCPCCQDCSALESARSAAVEEKNEMTMLSQQLIQTCTELQKQSMTRQSELLQTLGVKSPSLHSDSSDIDSPRKCDCVDLQTLLRKTVADLMTESDSKSVEIGKLKAKTQSLTMNLEKVRADLANARDVKSRQSKQLGIQKSKVTCLHNEIEGLQQSIQSYENKEEEYLNTKRESHQLRTKISTSTRCYEKQLAKLRSEVKYQAERADGILALGVQERDELENTLNMQWNERNTSLARQIEEIKATYRHSLAESQEEEAKLRVQLAEQDEQYTKKSEVWDNCRKSFIIKISELKDNFDKKCKILGETIAEKLELKTELASMTDDLESCQSSIEENINERRRLTKNITSLEARLKALMPPVASYSNVNIYLMESEGLDNSDIRRLPEIEGLTAEDFQTMKHQMIESMGLRVPSASTSPGSSEPSLMSVPPLTTDRGEVLPRIDMPRLGSDEQCQFVIGLGRNATTTTSKGRLGAPRSPVASTSLASQLGPMPRPLHPSARLNAAFSRRPQNAKKPSGSKAKLPSIGKRK